MYILRRLYELAQTMATMTMVVTAGTHRSGDISTLPNQHYGSVRAKVPGLRRSPLLDPPFVVLRQLTHPHSSRSKTSGTGTGDSPTCITCCSPLPSATGFGALCTNALYGHEKARQSQGP